MAPRKQELKQVADPERCAVKGAWVDLVRIDPVAVIDGGTFEEPSPYPAGLHTIFVNGQMALLDDKVTGHRAGQELPRAS